MLLKINSWNYPSLDDEELFIRWARGEPIGGAEDHVELYSKSDGTLVFNDIRNTSIRQVFCQKPNPHCHTGFKVLFT